MADKEAQADEDMIDENELAKIGYKQELKRDLSLVQVCDIYLLHASFSSLSHSELWVWNVFISRFLTLRQHSQSIVQYHQYPNWNTLPLSVRLDYRWTGRNGDRVRQDFDFSD